MHLVIFFLLLRLFPQVLFLLNPYGFHEFKQDPTAFVSASGAADSASGVVAGAARLASLQAASLRLIWGWPLLVGILQVLVFSPYTLRNTHENMIAKHVES